MVNCISSSSLRFVRLASMEGGQKGQRCERSTQRKRSMSERRDEFDEEERRSLDFDLEEERRSLEADI